MGWSALPLREILSSHQSYTGILKSLRDTTQPGGESDDVVVGKGEYGRAGGFHPGVATLVKAGLSHKEVLKVGKLLGEVAAYFCRIVGGPVVGYDNFKPVERHRLGE